MYLPLVHWQYYMAQAASVIWGGGVPVCRHYGGIFLLGHKVKRGLRDGISCGITKKNN